MVEQGTVGHAAALADQCGARTLVAELQEAVQRGVEDLLPTTHPNRVQLCFLSATTDVSRVFLCCALEDPATTSTTTAVDSGLFALPDAHGDLQAEARDIAARFAPRAREIRQNLLTNHRPQPEFWSTVRARGWTALMDSSRPAEAAGGLLAMTVVLEVLAEQNIVQWMPVLSTAIAHAIASVGPSPTQRRLLHARLQADRGALRCRPRRPGRRRGGQHRQTAHRRVGLRCRRSRHAGVRSRCLGRTDGLAGRVPRRPAIPFRTGEQRVRTRLHRRAHAGTAHALAPPAARDARGHGPRLGRETVDWQHRRGDRSLGQRPVPTPFRAGRTRRCASHPWPDRPWAAVADTGRASPSRCLGLRAGPDRARSLDLGGAVDDRGKRRRAGGAAR